MSLKNPVTPPGIDFGTVRLVVQRLNHYATAELISFCISRRIILSLDRVSFTKIFQHLLIYTFLTFQYHSQPHRQALCTAICLYH